MIVLVDIFTEDELVTDSYELKNLAGNPAVLQGAESDGIATYKSKMVVVGGEEDIDIGCGNAFANPNAEEEGVDAQAGEQKPDLVAKFNLAQHQLDKKDFAALIKAYFKNLKEKLTNETAQAKFKKHWESEIAPTLKKITETFNDWGFFVGQGGTLDGMIIPAQYGEDAAPTFYFFLDGVRVEKL